MSNPGTTRYIIVGMQRSGTTATNRALFGHPNICAMADEFAVDPFFTKGVACFTVGGQNRWERLRNYARLFDAVTIYPADTPDPEGKRLIAYCGTPKHPKQEVRANGLKVAIPSANDARLLVESLREYFRDLRVVHVRRADWVAQYASLLRAQKSGQWHSWTTANPPAALPERLTIPVDAFTNYVRMALEIEGQLLRLRETHQVCEFNYESDLEHAAGAWDRLFEFLGVLPMQPDWMGSSKVAPPVEEFVTNVAELRQALARLRP